MHGTTFKDLDYNFANDDQIAIVTPNDPMLLVQGKKMKF